MLFGLDVRPQRKNYATVYIQPLVGNITKSEFSEIRESIMNERDILRQGVMYFVINRCSFSGATLSGGFSLEAAHKRFTQSSVERIRSLQLDARFDMYNMDFEEFLGSMGATSESALLFLDPP